MERQELNLGLLDEKRKRCHCTMQSPPPCVAHSYIEDDNDSHSRTLIGESNPHKINTLNLSSELASHSSTTWTTTFLCYQVGVCLPLPSYPLTYPHFRSQLPRDWSWDSKWAQQLISAKQEMVLLTRPGFLTL